MMRILEGLFAVGIAVVVAVTVNAEGVAAPVTDEVTIADRGHNAYGRAVPNLDAQSWERMHAGKRVFVRTWAPPGEGTGVGEGLGPLYNAPSCTACHFKDGRGGTRATPQPAPPVLLRLDTRPHADTHGWGAQLQDQGVARPPEGQIATIDRVVTGTFTDGTPFQLQASRHRVVDVEPPLAVSARMPPTLIGVGLLEVVPTDEIVAWADPDDGNGDGISGRARWVEDAHGRVLGRFGWKADQPTLTRQVAAALAEDMGVSTVHRLAAFDDEPEMSTEEFDLLIDYLRFLAPPAPRLDDGPRVAQGAELFESIGCAVCHRPKLTTSAAVEMTGNTALTARTIRPYTDLLLHDMGPELADDDLGEPGVAASEWRTAPLWGLGLMETVNGALYLMHDGRARSFEEAILWHGGEAQASRERFRSLPRDARDALVAFVRSR